MSKLPCEVVKDLLPSYIDELTSEVTNNLIEEHNAECEDCRRTLESMKNPEPEPTKQPKQKEIDYLKKTRKKNRKNVFVAILVVLALVLGGLGVKHYFIGSIVSPEYLECRVEVDGKVLTVSCVTVDKDLCISDIDFAEKDGVIDISCKVVGKSAFKEGGAGDSYVAENTIKEVRLGDRILWANGEHIAAITSEVYQTRHAYVGDMVANNETLNALHMDMAFGDFKNQLQTTEEPYGWHFQMGELRLELQHMKEHYMRPYACVLLAVVENLGEVTFEYTYDGEPMKRTFTEKTATIYAGKDIKEVGKDVAELQKFIGKTILPYIGLKEDTIQLNPEDVITFDILNLTEDTISVIEIECYPENFYSMVAGGAGCYMDRTVSTNGETISVEVTRDIFEENPTWDGVEQMGIKVVINKNRIATFDSKEGMNVPMEFGKTYQLKLTGSAEDGYHISVK